MNEIYPYISISLILVSILINNLIHHTDIAKQFIKRKIYGCGVFCQTELPLKVKRLNHFHSYFKIEYRRWNGEKKEMYLSRYFCHCFPLLMLQWIGSHSFSALYGYLFSSSSEAAFSNYRLWESVGFIVAFAYSGFLCTQVKIFICMGVLVTGMLGYFAVEVYEHRGKSHDLKHEKSWDVD